MARVIDLVERHIQRYHLPPDLVMSTVTISRRGAERIAAGHPWVYRSDVFHAHEAAAGEVVRVQDRRARFLGMAHYSAASEIAVRMLSTRDRAMDRAFFREMLEKAHAHRQRV